jgi:7-cyano-7-deazaguanine reductase
MSDPRHPAPLHLGQTSALPASPEEAVLDYVPNPRVGTLYLVRFAAPEFTSLCPVTGQPDFAHLVIDYAPGETIVDPSRSSCSWARSATTTAFMKT